MEISYPCRLITQTCKYEFSRFRTRGDSTFPNSRYDCVVQFSKLFYGTVENTKFGRKKILLKSNNLIFI